MPAFIDDEAEPADAIFAGGNEITSHVSGRAIAALGGEAFDKARLLIGPDGCDHDPIVGVFALEGAPILGERLPRRQNDAMDLFVGVGLTVTERPVRATPFEIRKQMWEAHRDLRPLAVLLVPAAGIAISRVDLQVGGLLDMEATVPSG